MNQMLITCFLCGFLVSIALAKVFSSLYKMSQKLVVTIFTTELKCERRNFRLNQAVGLEIIVNGKGFIITASLLEYQQIMQVEVFELKK